MIYGDFYPSDVTEANTGNKLTAQIQTLNMSEFSAAYWLGWIKYENVPSIYHLSEFSIEDDAYVFTDVTKVKNYNVGYLSTYNEYLRSNNAILYPTDPVTVLGPSDYARYINKLDVMSTGIRNTYQIDFRVAMQGGTWRDMGYPIQTMAQMLGYLNGDNTVTITFQNHIYQTITKSFKLTDMTDGALEWEAGSIQYVVTILGFHIGTPVRDLDENGNYGQYISPTPCIDIETESHRFISAPAIGPFTRANFQTSFRWSTDTWADTNYSAFFSGYTYYCSGLQGSIPKTLTTETNRYLICGNMLVFNDSPNYTFRITRIYTIDDIKKFIGLQIRIVSQNASPYTSEAYGYMEDDGVNPIGVYAPYVTDQNEFTTDIITGSLSDTAFKDKLRDWQYDQTKWEANDYKESDLPPYGPDPEGDDLWDSDFFGDFPAPSLTDVEIPSDFITHWVCSKTGVAAFGSLLWKDLLDFDTTDPDNPSPIPKICQNIRIALANYYVTGSFDTAAVMDFILGLRYYPFDLSSYASDSSQNNIYFGTGRVGVNSGENAYRLNKMSIYIYGGYVNVKTAFETQAKGDWRDYADAEAIIYVPFCGSARVAIEDVWNRVVHIYYGIDLSSGAMSAYVYSYSLDGSSNRQLIACLNGLVGFEIPVTATNANRLSAAVIGDLTNAANAFTSPIKQDFSKAIGVMSGKMQGSGKDGGGAVGGSGDVADLVNTSSPQMFVASQGLRSVGGLASEAAGILTRPAISCPAMNGGAGWGTLQGPLEAAIQIRRCRYYDDSGYSHSVMHPFATKKRIGDMNGYGMTQCVNVDTSGLTCTTEEREMIASYLQSGVYL